MEKRGNINRLSKGDLAIEAIFVGFTQERGS